LFISLLIWIVRRLSELPGACQAVRAPSALATGLWYAGLILFFTGPVRWRKGALLLVFSSCLLWSAVHIAPYRDIRILRSGDSAVALCLPEKKQWILVMDGDPFSTARTIRLLQKEGINRLHTLAVTDKQADAGAVRRLQEIFRPAQTLSSECGDELYWPAGGGFVRVSPSR